MTTRNFDERVRPQMPADAIKGTGTSLRFFAPTLLRVYTMIRLERKCGRPVCPKCYQPLSEDHELLDPATELDDDDN